MATTTHRETIAASADSVFAVVGAFGDNSWMGVEITCEGDGLGAVRKVAMPTGLITELCEVHDAAARQMGYAILDGNPFVAEDYHGLITVEPIDATSCELIWSATYEPAGDADPVELDGELARFLKGAARAVKRYAES